MPHAFIFHGTEGFPEENWFPWLKKELESLGYTVHVPQFPTPENQTLEAWFAVLKEYESFINGETIMIGHSLGGAFLLRVLEKRCQPIALACFVAAPVGVLPIKNYDGDKLFIGHPFDWENIRKNARQVVVFHSDNDPYVSLGNGQELARQLGVDLDFVPNAGHFNMASGYTKFEDLLRRMEDELRL